MNRKIWVGVATGLALGFTASVASALCDYEHPRKTTYLRSGLVQAMVSCNNPGGNAPNDTTEGGVPSCSPPETFNEQAGSPSTGWLWNEERSTGFVQFTPSKNKVVNVLNPPENTADLKVRMVLRRIMDANGDASGSGTLATVARATLNDRQGTSIKTDDVAMTVVDFPAGFPFTMNNGNASIKTSANVLLNGIAQPGLPTCSSIEVVSVTVVDPNGNNFANLGSYLPEPW